MCVCVCLCHSLCLCECEWSGNTVKEEKYRLCTEIIEALSTKKNIEVLQNNTEVLQQKGEKNKEATIK